LNKNELTYLLSKPNAINETQTMALEAILLQFPYFQSARALHLKGLYNQDSFRYNYELKKTAAHTTDRSILFDFITSEKFVTLQKSNIDAQEEIIKEVNVIDSEILSENPAISESLEPITTEDSEAMVSESIESSTFEEKLEIGKPLHFNQQEKHSFQEWLQLTKFSPIERKNESTDSEIANEKQKKIALIDRFIENNPKIPAIKETLNTPAIIDKKQEDNNHLMTETLAKVYLEQKKYQRAIQAYEILILKYPEKSSFFADQIKNIKDLQQNNN
jgi:tetratricopeptide (TPR) repeat protein